MDEASSAFQHIIIRHKAIEEVRSCAMCIFTIGGPMKYVNGEFFPDQFSDPYVKQKVHKHVTYDTGDGVLTESVWIPELSWRHSLHQFVPAFLWSNDITPEHVKSTSANSPTRIPTSGTVKFLESCNIFLLGFYERFRPIVELRKKHDQNQRNVLKELSRDEGVLQHVKNIFRNTFK